MMSILKPNKLCVVLCLGVLLASIACANDTVKPGVEKAHAAQGIPAIAEQGHWV